MDIFQLAREFFVLFFAVGVYTIFSFIETIITIGKNEEIGLTSVENKAIFTFSLILGVSFVIVCLKETADPDFLKAGGYFLKYMLRQVPYAEVFIVIVSALIWTCVILKISEGICVTYLFMKSACFVIPMQARKLFQKTREWTQKHSNKSKEDHPLFHS